MMSRPSSANSARYSPSQAPPLARSAFDQYRIVIIKTMVIFLFNVYHETAVRRDYRAVGFIAHIHSFL